MCLGEGEYGGKDMIQGTVSLDIETTDRYTKVISGFHLIIEQVWGVLGKRANSNGYKSFHLMRLLSIKEFELVREIRSIRKMKRMRRKTGAPQSPWHPKSRLILRSYTYPVPILDDSPGDYQASRQPK